MPNYQVQFYSLILSADYQELYQHLMFSNECLINNQQYYILFLNNNVNLFMYHNIYPYPLLPIPINTFHQLIPHSILAFSHSVLSSLDFSTPHCSP